MKNNLENKNNKSDLVQFPDKKSNLKRYQFIIGGLFAFSMIAILVPLIYLIYHSAPFVIIFPIFLAFVFAIGYLILVVKGLWEKRTFFCCFSGSLMIIIAGFIILSGGRSVISYTGIVLGFYLLFSGIKMMKRKK